MNKFMQEAIKEANKGIRKNHGGPFGVVIVYKDKIVGRGHNEVVSRNDPTAHAEILAIQKASKKLKKFDLSGCILYSTCEPCPMCFSAIHWARISKVYYGCVAKDAANIGFDDKFIYDIIRGKAKEKIKVVQTHRKECLKSFEEWDAKPDKTPY